MKASFSLAFVLASACSCAATEVTPVQKVIALLTGMLEEGKKEKHDEQEEFAKYKSFCEDTAAEKKKSIGEYEEQIEILKADIGKYTEDAKELAKEIEVLEADVAAWTGDTKAATKVRR